MMKTRDKLVRFGTGALLVGALSMPVLQATASEIEVMPSPTGLWFQLPESQDSILSISGASVDVVIEFQAGDTLQFSGTDENGNQLPDGSYTYDIRTVPEQDEEALAVADAANDAKRLAELWDQAQSRTHVASGEFEIVNGMMAAPEETGEQD